jgi:hypothetical protein
VEAHGAVRRRGSHIFNPIGSQMAVRLSALGTGRPLLPGRFLVLISVRGLVDPRVIERLEGLVKLKKSDPNFWVPIDTIQFSTFNAKLPDFSEPLGIAVFLNSVHRVVLGRGHKAFGTGSVSNKSCRNIHCVYASNPKVRLT